jgi:tetrahydromethanopterin S-methyltransferase subunit D
MNLEGLAKGTQILAAVSSIALARRRTKHVPAAVALVVLAAIPLVRRPLKDALAPLSRPVEGAARMLVYVDGAAELATYATIAGLAVAVAVSQQNRWRVFTFIVAAWALGSIVLGAAYPSPLVRGEGLQRVYFAADLIGLFVSAIALVGWAQRKLAAKRSPDTTSFVAMGLVALDATILLAPFSPWRGTLYGSDFTGISLVIVLWFAAFSIAQVMAVWRSSSSSRGSP